MAKKRARSTTPKKRTKSAANDCITKNLATYCVDIRPSSDPSQCYVNLNSIVLQKSYDTIAWCTDSGNYSVDTFNPGPPFQSSPPFKVANHTCTQPEAISTDTEPKQYDYKVYKVVSSSPQVCQDPNVIVR